VSRASAGPVQRKNGRLEESLAVPPSAPWKWRLDDRGRPSWIPLVDGASWATVFEWELILGHLVHVEMPLIVPPQGANGHLADTSTTLARRAAGLRDLYKCSNEYIGRQLALATGSSDAAAAARAAKRHVREGREVLNDAGVLPWAAFEPAGRLPKRWWREAAFLGALGEWRRQAVSMLPARTVGDAALEALAAAWRVERELLLRAPGLIRRAVPHR
jgi:hypothetical protein